MGKCMGRGGEKHYIEDYVEYYVEYYVETMRFDGTWTWQHGGVHTWYAGESIGRIPPCGGRGWIRGGWRKSNRKQR